MYNSQSQKLRKHQQPKTDKEVKREQKTTIRKAKRNKHNLWIVKGEI